MELPTTLQGRDFGATELCEIRSLLESNAGLSRYRISRLLAAQWQWHTATGQLKDMAARTLLLKLHRRGWIELPACRRASPTRSGRVPPSPANPTLDEATLSTTLADLRPIQIVEVSSREQRAHRKQLEAALHRYHYLGYQSRVGQNVQYRVSDGCGSPLACLAFGAPAWQCAPRDQWIGWSPAQRAQNLSRIAGNTRFLIFPWVRALALTEIDPSVLTKTHPPGGSGGW